MDSYGVFQAGNYLVSVPGVTIFIAVFAYQIYLVAKVPNLNPPMRMLLGFMFLGFNVLVWTLLGVWPISRW